MLYIILAESLSRKLEAKRIFGNLPGIQNVHGVKSLNHSQFIDDNLLLGGASRIIDLRFKQVLNTFLDALGGEVNHRK
jgi:hypothetical protein